jgi:hypothetical protein
MFQVKVEAVLVFTYRVILFFLLLPDIFEHFKSAKVLNVFSVHKVINLMLEFTEFLSTC